MIEDVYRTGQYHGVKNTYYSDIGLASAQLGGQVGRTLTPASRLDLTIDRVESIGRSLEMTADKLREHMNRIHGAEACVGPEWPESKISDIDKPSGALARLNEAIDRLNSVANGLEVQTHRAASI